jgi:hypothetical protein
MGDEKILETQSVHQNSLDRWRNALTQAEKQAVLHARLRELMVSRWRKLGRKLGMAKAASFEE